VCPASLGQLSALVDEGCCCCGARAEAAGAIERESAQPGAVVEKEHHQKESTAAFSVAGKEEPAPWPLCNVAGRQRPLGGAGAGAGQRAGRQTDRQTGAGTQVLGDGRELVATDAGAVKIRAEDGRRVEGVDISPFIANLPYGRDTRDFRTADASGSTSQAANIQACTDAREGPKHRIVPVQQDQACPVRFVDEARRSACSAVVSLLSPSPCSQHPAASGAPLCCRGRLSRATGSASVVCHQCRGCCVAGPLAQPGPKQPLCACVCVAWRGVRACVCVWVCVCVAHFDRVKRLCRQ
jgi:Predicted ATPase of the ABC class